MDKWKIMVVEDDAPVQHLITASLSAEDYTVIVAETAAAAVQLAATQNQLNDMKSQLSECQKLNAQYKKEVKEASDRLAAAGDLFVDERRTRTGFHAVFLADPVDTYYQTRREHSTVVTAACSRCGLPSLLCPARA